MDLMNRYGLIYGTSVCYTRANAEVVTSDEFLDLEIEKGCMFSWYFHFMPTGNGASPELMPTPEQRKYMIKRIREIRANEGGKQIYTMDFQNDGEFVGGCIAGGRNYFHINSNGDAGTLRIHPLLQREHQGSHAAGSAQKPPVHGLSPGTAL